MAISTGSDLSGDKLEFGGKGQALVLEPVLGGSRRLEIVDCAKGFAIATIVAMHALDPISSSSVFDRLIHFGGSGVHLFIFLSGFGLGISRETGRGWKDFFKHRIFKILLPYYVCVTTIYGLNSFLHLYKDGFYAWSGHVLWFKMFDERIMTSFGYHFWFLSTILQLYAVYPLLVWAKKKMGMKFFWAGSLALSAAWWIWTAKTGLYTQRIYGSFFLQYLWEFCLGMCSVQVYREGGRSWSPSPMATALIGSVALGVYAVSGWVGGVAKVFNDIPSFVGYGCLFLTCFYALENTSGRGAVAAKQALRWMGKNSYPIYLWHALAVGVTFRMLHLLYH